LIDVRYKARLGNNLFQYCLGRILAETLGFALQAPTIPGFPNTAATITGALYEQPEQTLTGHLIDLERVLGDSGPRRIVLDGWFQRYDYYRPYRGQIQQWLAFAPSIEVPDPRNGVVVHVRRTDFVRLGWALPFAYYTEALERVRPNGANVWIVTDDHRDPFFKQFAPWRPRFHSGTALEQMLFMTRATRLVMSQSTFSWWPTFLGNPTDVVCPVPAFGAWSENGEARDANLIEQDRFTCLACDKPYEPTASESRHQSRRAQWRRAVLAVNRRLGLSLPEPPP
jgi:hypothetical protein